jgi:Flp pilus assembly protein TadG
VTERESGSMTVELVVLTPVLVLFALFAIAVGRYEMARDQVIGAARAGAEAASVASSPSQADAVARAAAMSGADNLGHTCSNLKVTTDTSDFATENSIGVEGSVSVEGSVGVTVACQVSYSGLLFPGMPGSTMVRAVQTAPIDPYRTVQ